MFAIRVVLTGLLVACIHDWACGQACPYGEAPADECWLAREIPWSIGQHVVIVDPGNATGQEQLCGVSTGRTVWFAFTAASNEHVRISTCHPATSYDTVMQVWRGGDSVCGSMTDLECSDDVFERRCANGCNTYGSEVSFDTIQGARYRFAVGAYDDNHVGCPLCLGVIVTIGYPCGDPPTNLSCELAQELPGIPGTHETFFDVQDASVLPTEPVPMCGFNGGHTVWFQVTPAVYGPMTFSTCHSATEFDTIVQAYTGSCAGILAALDCNDDFPHATCRSSCQPEATRSSEVTVFGEKGQTYYFQVGSYNDNAAGCTLCLGATLTIEDICETDTTPPLAEITSPGDFACACSQIEIVGTADDPDGAWGYRHLEYKPIGGGTWQTITTDISPVSDDVLGVWDTTGLSDGWYLLRHTSTNICDRSSTAVRLVRVDKAFGSLTLRSPVNGNILGGLICADGTAWDDCFQNYIVQWRAVGGALSPVDPAHPTYPTSVLNDPLASWPSASRPDGNYEVKLSGTTTCGHSSSVSASVVLDNTAPIALITSPESCSALEGAVEIRGTAADAHLAGWVLQYTGGDAHGWVTIASGNTTVVNGVLANWNVSSLRPCAYVLRLIATDAAVLNCNGALHNQSEYTVAVLVNWEELFDADRDGDVDLYDFSFFLGAFHGPNMP